MQVDERKLNQFFEHAMSELSAGCGGVMVGLGHKLSLYRAMAGAGPLSVGEVVNPV